MLDFTARTGLRASEVLGLEGRHLHLTGELAARQGPAAVAQAATSAR